VEHRVVGDLPSLAGAVGRWVDAAVAGDPDGYVALAVGDSTLPLFCRLGPRPAGVRVICLDELVPPPTDRRATFAARLRAALPPDWACALVPFDTGFDDPDRIESALAGRLLAAVCGVGPDGHVAFNQPPEDGTSRTRLVDIAPSNLARLGDVTPAAHALTLGLATIASARRLALVITGNGKEEATRRFLAGAERDDCPATHLLGHPDLSIFTLGTISAKPPEPFGSDPAPPII
jgi:glucosamine-6-phosphate deaminase